MNFINFDHTIIHNFFCIEGVNGVGKTTIIKELEKKFKLENPEFKIAFLKEPSNLIKEAVDNINQVEFASDYKNKSLASLHKADRIHTIFNKKNGISKLYYDNNSIVIDRYELSTYAYQGYWTGVDVFMPSTCFYITSKIENLKKRTNRLPDNVYEIKQRYRDGIQEFYGKYKNIFRCYELLNDTEEDLVSSIQFIYNTIIKQRQRFEYYIKRLNYYGKYA